MAKDFQDFLTDYIDVATRITEFREKYPEGTLRPLNLDKPYTLETVDGKPWVVVVAAAYRRPDDPNPGIGMAYEPIPGKTKFTSGSELQNAETAAWGRAMVAALAVDTRKGIASAEEVRNRRADQAMEKAFGAPEKKWPTAKQVEEELAKATDMAQFEKVRATARAAAASGAYNEETVESFKSLFAQAEQRINSANPGAPSVEDLMDYIENVQSQDDYDKVKAGIDKSGFSEQTKKRLYQQLDKRADEIGSETLPIE